MANRLTHQIIYFSLNLSNLISSDFIFFYCISVAPDTINNHVKTCREEKKSLHFFAPEYGGESRTTAGKAATCVGVSLILISLCFLFSWCQCHHSRGYLFIWNVRLRGEREWLWLEMYSSTCICYKDQLNSGLSPLSPQMAVLEIQSNGDSSYVSQEAINNAIQSLEDPLQRVSRR